MNIVPNNQDFMTASIRETLTLSAESMAKMLQVSTRTVCRWEEEKRAPRNPLQVLRLHRIKEIFDLGSQVYTPEGMREFLFKPQPVFNGKTAFQLISIGDYDLVLSALAADHEGLGF